MHIKLITLKLQFINKSSDMLEKKIRQLIKKILIMQQTLESSSKNHY